jgi:excisionase family DNA binding protein
MESYNARVEVDDRAPITSGVDVDAWMEVLGQYRGAPSMSVRGFREASLFVPAETLAQATSTAVAVVSSMYGAKAIAAEVMTEKEFDAREGWMTLPELISVSEAAELLGVSRQAVLDRIRRGTLQAEKVGDSYVIPRHQLPA